MSPFPSPAWAMVAAGSRMSPASLRTVIDPLRSGARPQATSCPASCATVRSSGVTMTRPRKSSLAKPNRETRIVAPSALRTAVQAPRVEAAAQVLAGLDRRLESHPRVQVGDLAWRLSGHDAVDHALVIGEPRLLLLED